MNTRLKNVILPLAIVALLVLSPGLVSAGAIVLKDVSITPVDRTIYNTCMAEAIHVTGSLHVSRHTIYADNGNVHTQVHENYQNLRGVGLSSGITYQIVDVSSNNSNRNTTDQSNLTITDIYKIIGQGQAKNYEMHVTRHYTTNANGEQVVAESNIHTYCK